MNFLERIKSNLADPRNRRGMQEKVLVDSRALRELLHHFEALDSAERARYSDDPSEWCNRLRLAIEAAYYNNGRDGSELLLLVMDILRPLMAETAKEQTVEYQFRGWKP